jgi:DNA-binding response OmpR family regulator
MKHTHNSILIADDNKDNRDLLSRCLEKQGYTVATAEDGQQALDMMAVENFDLLLLDIIMPVMDGYAVLKKMNTDLKQKTLPVIVLTAETETSNVIRCIELGANDYLVKPFDMVVLRNRIVRALLNRRLREEVTGELNWLGEQAPAILIVEDDDMSRDLLQKRVSRAGYRVVSVANGSAALETLSKQSFGLVLLDIMMPGMSGYDVLKHLNTNNKLSDMSVIMISALDDQETIERCMQAGAEDYITKPFNALLLKSRILSCLQSNSVKDAALEKQKA